MYLFFNRPTTDYQFLLSSNGSVPVSSGLENEGITSYVYANERPECGTVPLYALSAPSVGDHVYTIFEDEKDLLLAGGPGWVDEGIIAHVLPLKHCAFTY
uniref:DUF5648 domain-containing protein n=1 Tax=Psilocybe cubensis TaxID=181762 RepID=A0A8H7XVD2_PSICU